jgi:imidazoleglycerol phosphate synthase glutamine amidotransferase subunit HisH
MRCSSATLSGLLAVAGRVAGLRNGLAKTPPMGWVSLVRRTCNRICQIPA